MAQNHLKKFFNKKRVLITGHTGFKGSWLTQILLTFGANISGIGLAPDSSPSLYKILKLKNKINNHFVDIKNYQQILNILKRDRPEIIFHLAAQALVRKSYEEPLQTFSTNIMGTANLLEAIRVTDSAKSVVIVTTDKVYEEKRFQKYSETDPLGGHDPYSTSKAAADLVSQSYIKSFFNPEKYGIGHQTLIAISRNGNVIGGGDWSHDRLIPDLVKANFVSKSSVNIRNPQSIRTWSHVLDILWGNLLLAERLYDKNVDFIGPWNFGPSQQSFITVEKMVQRAKHLLKDLKYETSAADSRHEADTLMLNSGKSRKILGWQPKFNIKKTMTNTIEWYKRYYQRESDMELFTNEQIKNYLKV